MSRPARSSWRGTAIGVMVLVLLAPSLLTTAAETVNHVLSVLAPWVIAGAVLFVLYVLVVRRYRG